jgi:hypothetical protein
MYAGFPTPEHAYRRYAEAINAGAFCEAINTFAPSSRSSVAFANWKGLALLAGMDNPNRPAYLARFLAFCAGHQLPCNSDQQALALALRLMNGEALTAELPELHALLARAPEDTYVEIMTQLAAVDQPAMAKFETELVDGQSQGERATGRARQQTGGSSTLTFARSPSGWMIEFE